MVDPEGLNRARGGSAMEEGLPEGGGGGGAGAGVPTVPAVPVTRAGKSCKGCLYYSSLMKSDARNPICVGISRSLDEVPGYIIGESEMEATRDGRSLTDFKYGCIGYSVFLDNKNKSSENSENTMEVPFCVGLELLVDRRPSSAEYVPVHARNKEGSIPHAPLPRPHKPAHNVGGEFFGRYTRNAGLVASGVARNLRRVGNYVKENLDDIFYPYRRRPK